MAHPHPRVDILIATYRGNIPEVRQNIPTIISFCQAHLKEVDWRITLAHNGPDRTHLAELAAWIGQWPNIRITHVEKSGKGSAILNGFMESPADVVAYMDADLATNLDSLPKLIHLAATKKADLVSGSRYHQSSQISRNALRLTVSLVYTQLILRSVLDAHFTDPQCGFKAMRKETMQHIIPLVQDAWFFFETEFTYLAQREGLRIEEIEVEWVERPNSSVKLVPTIINFLKNIYRLKSKSITVAPQKPSWTEKVEIIRESEWTHANK